MLVAPGGSNFPVIAAGSIWVPRMDEGDLVRVDIETNELLATIPISRAEPSRGPHAIAVHRYRRLGRMVEEVWVNAEDERGWALLRIDPETNEVAQRIEVGVPGYSMDIVDDTLWMTSFENDRLIRVDLRNPEGLAELGTLSKPVGLAATDEAVWVAIGRAGMLARVDPVTLEYSLVHSGTRRTMIPAIVADEVWVTTADGAEILVVEQASQEVIERIPAQSPLGIIEQDGLVWVTDHSREGSLVAQERIIAIDAATREIVREIPLTGLGVDRGITSDGHSLWVVTAAGLARLEP